MPPKQKSIHIVFQLAYQYVDLSVAHFLLSEIYSTITEYILHFYILNELTHTVLDLPNNLHIRTTLQYRK